MDSADDNAVSSEPEVRRTRSGRAVKTPPAPAAKQQTQRKTRKKIVLVEVEVSDEEDDNPDQNTSTDNVCTETVEKVENNEDSNSVQINDINNESSLEPNDSISGKDESELNSNHENSNINENQDSSQTNDNILKDEEEKNDVEDNVDKAEVSIENIDAEKPIEEVTEALETGKTSEINENSETEQPSQVVNKEPMETEAIESDSDKDETEKMEVNQTDDKTVTTEDDKKENTAIDQDTENISEDELPTVQAAKVPETEEVSDEELPGPKLAELPADTEVVSEDELPTVKKESTKRKLEENEYDPGSPTSENETAAKKPALDNTSDVKKEEKPKKKKKLPELDKYWKAVNDDPTDFTGWTYLLQYVDQENDMEAAREAYDAFLSHYPYCYGYWRKYADYEKRKGNKKKCEEVFERGLKAIPLSVDLWLHYLNYTRSTHGEDEDHIRAQYERALTACGLEFRSDRLWDGYIKWETEGKRLQNVTKIYDRLLATPTQGYTNHFDNFQEHVASHVPNKILEVDEFLALRKEVRHMLKHDSSSNDQSSDAPPGEGEQDSVATDEETTALKERIVSIRRKIHKNTVNAVTARWNFEEGIKRPYFHVKPLERCQLKNWKEYLDYEIEQGDQSRIVVLFERCLIACALYEEFWLRFVHYLENCNDSELKQKIKDVYERACTIHHLNKPTLHLQWAMFEEYCENYPKAAEILVNLEKSVPNLLQVAYRRINLERRRNDLEKCSQLYEHYITNSKNKMISSNLAIKYARFCLKVCKNTEKSIEILNKAIEKDSTNPRLYLQLIDMVLQKENIVEKDVLDHIDQFLSKDDAEIEQKVLFAQRKLEFLEDFGSDIKAVQKAYEEYQKYFKLNKDKKKKEDTKSDKKSKEPPTAQSSYNNYGNYGSAQSTQAPASYTQYSSAPTQGQYGSQYGQYSQNDQYQYQNWQYSQSGYGGYGNQWGGYGNYY